LKNKRKGKFGTYFYTLFIKVITIVVLNPFFTNPYLNLRIILLSWFETHSEDSTEVMWYILYCRNSVANNYINILFILCNKRFTLVNRKERILLPSSHQGKYSKNIPQNLRICITFLYWKMWLFLTSRNWTRNINSSFTIWIMKHINKTSITYRVKHFISYVNT